MPIIPAFMRLRQEFKISLGYIVETLSQKMRRIGIIYNVVTVTIED
jgi:hypothetical protein